MLYYPLRGRLLLGGPETLVGRTPMLNAASTAAPCPFQAFADFCADLGYDIGGLPEPSGRIVRFRAPGDKGDAKSGYYFFHADAPANGEVGTWRGDIKHKWRAQGRSRRHPSVSFDERRRERQRQREEEQERAALEARHRWKDGQTVHQHPYLTRKGIGPHGARLWRERLIIPIYSPQGVITSAQYIFGDGSKRFHPKGEISGGVYLIGPRPGDIGRIIACEGFATGATIHEATGASVFVGFFGSNMVRACRWLAEKYGRPIDIAGDEDAHLEKNVGRIAAEQAAAITGGRTFFPDMRGHEGTDFNDQAAAYGLDSVAETLRG